MGKFAVYDAILNLDMDHLTVKYPFASHYYQRVSETERKSTCGGALQLAAERGSTSEVQNLIESALDSQALLAARGLGGCTALHLAANVDVVHTILQHANDIDILLQAVNAGGSTPLHFAALIGDKEMCTAMLQSATDPQILLQIVNRSGKTALEWASDFATKHLLCTYRAYARLGLT